MKASPAALSLLLLCAGCQGKAVQSGVAQGAGNPPAAATGAAASSGSAAPAGGATGAAAAATAAGAGSAGKASPSAGNSGQAGTSAGSSGRAADAGGGAGGASGAAPTAGSSGQAGAVAGSSAQAAAAGGGGAAAAGTGSSGQGDGDISGARVPQLKKTACIDTSKLQWGTETNFPCEGVDLWIVAAPVCQTRPCGLIFNIHGGGMTDHATMDQATNMIKLGGEAGYIVVHPHKGTWNVASDRTAVFGFLQQTIEAFDVDRKRVHSTGYSQGGQLSWALACEHADVVASIAPAEEINRVTDCWKPSKLPVREIPVLFAYGKRDSIGGGYAAAQQLVNDFVSASKLMGPEIVAGTESSNYFRQRWTSSTGGVLEFISQNYTSTGVGGILAGHCLPMKGGNTFVSCAAPVDYDWGKEVVTFFQAHPMP